MSLFAHSNGPDKATWQLLEDHLENVASSAANYAKPFNSSFHAQLLGWIHDIGKARTSFQSYLFHCNGIEDIESDFSDHSHSGAGACWLASRSGNIGTTLAYCVAGHHAGLPDWSGGETPTGTLSVRLQDEKNVLNEENVHRWVSSHELQWLSQMLKPPFSFSRDDSSVSFWIRMLFSCLVDADFLDTEAFIEPDKKDVRSFGTSLNALAPTFFAYLDEKQNNSDDTPVNTIRSEIRAACEFSSGQERGLFSLTVPTGGGKTLSSMAFAFKHALKNDLKRIIYVIPYTSIIEQTADILRGILGDDNVLEHHSNYDSDKETIQSRLASENWDAPIIVTTSVQFFESLYSCKSSRCRKLHNISESVVILDEVQLLPTGLLLPCTEAIRQLVLHYKTAIVLSTATQLDLPGLDKRLVHEIVPARLDLYNRLKRTRIEFPADRSIRKSWKEIAAELSEYKRVLCVVNTRKDCRTLFDEMPEGTIHLSALMCGAHRSEAIRAIKQKLSGDEPVRVISTQLVESGVDIDFPIVYRAFTGLSSIAQSAGRCNREGLYGELGRVVVFMPPKESPRGELLLGEYAMADLLYNNSGINVDDAGIFPRYFKALHNRISDMGISFEKMLGVPVPKDFRNGTINSLPDPMKYQFREAAAAFRMIDNNASVSIIVRYGDSDKLIENLRRNGQNRTIMRQLQRYTISVPRNTLLKLINDGLVEELSLPSKPNQPSGIFVQTMPSAYSEIFGLDLFRDGLSIEDNLI